MPTINKGVSGIVHFFNRISYGIDKLNFLVDLLEFELMWPTNNFIEDNRERKIV